MLKVTKSATERETDLEYRPALPKDYKSIRRFLCEIGWEKNVGDDEQFSKILDNSDITVVALDNSGIVGFGRAICDNESIGYITMVAVSPDKRVKGIGKQIVTILIGDNPNIKWVLSSSKENFRFWEKMGFRSSQKVMVKLRGINTLKDEQSSTLKKMQFKKKHKFLYIYKKIVSLVCGN